MRKVREKDKDEIKELYFRVNNSLESHKTETLSLLIHYSEYNDQKRLERLHDSLCRCLDDLRRSQPD